MNVIKNTRKENINHAVITKYAQSEEMRSTKIVKNVTVDTVEISYFHCLAITKTGKK